MYNVENTITVEKDAYFEVIIDKLIIVNQNDTIQTVREYFDENNNPLKEYKEYEREI